jgi:hypothetical protein
MSKPKIAYLSGPMRGKPNNNFEAFDALKEKAVAMGFDEIISPADMDRADGKSVKGLCEADRQAVYFDRDVAAVKRCTHIIMMEGWEHSIGATAEYAMARWLCKEILDENFCKMKLRKVIYEHRKYSGKTISKLVNTSKK